MSEEEEVDCLVTAWPYQYIFSHGQLAVREVLTEAHLVIGAQLNKHLSSLKLDACYVEFF